MTVSSLFYVSLLPLNTKNPSRIEKRPKFLTNTDSNQFWNFHHYQYWYPFWKVYNIQCLFFLWIKYRYRLWDPKKSVSAKNCCRRVNKAGDTPWPLIGGQHGQWCLHSIRVLPRQALHSPGWEGGLPGYPLPPTSIILNLFFFYRVVWDLMDMCQHILILGFCNSVKNLNKVKVLLDA